MFLGAPEQLLEHLSQQSEEDIRAEAVFLNYSSKMSRPRHLTGALVKGIDGEVEVH